MATISCVVLPAVTGIPSGVGWNTTVILATLLVYTKDSCMRSSENGGQGPVLSIVAISCQRKSVERPPMQDDPHEGVRLA